jgi:phosphoribosylglycinamide formyltransferase-1
MLETVLLGEQSTPLRVMMLVSATGANLETVIRFCHRHPELAEMALVASDRTDTPALNIARAAGICTWGGNFEQVCGRRADCHTDTDLAEYEARASDYHDRLCARVDGFEASSGEIDLVILAYHRWIHGRFLDKFNGRIVNQHPGDLSLTDDKKRRLLIGQDPVGEALRRGFIATCTSTFLVDRSHDGGPILARGPDVPYEGKTPPARSDIAMHELKQKGASDVPVLTWVLLALAERRLSLLSDTHHEDASRVVALDGERMPLGGFQLPAADGTPADRLLTR